MTSFNGCLGNDALVWLSQQWAALNKEQKEQRKNNKWNNIIFSKTPKLVLSNCQAVTLGFKFFCLWNSFHFYFWVMFLSKTKCELFFGYEMYFQEGFETPTNQLFLRFLKEASRKKPLLYLQIDFFFQKLIWITSALDFFF